MTEHITVLSTFRDSEGRPHLFWRITLFWLGMVSILVLYTTLNAQARASNNPLLAYATMLIIYPGLVLGLTALFRRFLDQRPWRTLGLISLRAGFSDLLRGVGFMLLVSILTFGAITVLGWAKIVALQATAPILIGLLINTIISFITEPLIEEPANRGYIYRNLNSLLPCWLALLGQMLLFTCEPVAAYTICSWLGIIPFPSPSYMAIYIPQLLLFAFLLQLCRITRGNLWMSIGLHLTYLEVGRSIYQNPKALVRLEYGPSILQQFLLAEGGQLFLLLIGIILFLGWQYLRRRPIKWREIVPDEAGAKAH